MTAEPRRPQRWYDLDPTLHDLLELLRAFQNEVREQAAQFLARVEGEIGAEAMARFRAAQPNSQSGRRWYDQDPVIAQTVELLRVLPPEVQRQAASQFMETLQRHGISRDQLQAASGSSHSG